MNGGINIFIAVIFFLSLDSCTKPHDVHFHGNVTYECNGLPAAGVNVLIYEKEESPSDNSSGVLGEGTTDNNGNYSFTTSVTNRGSNSGYGIYGAIDQPEFVGGVYSTNSQSSDDRDGDVTLNGIANVKGNLICHIKNVNPYNDYDSFSLDFHSGSHPYVSVISNLIGSDVDTTITLVGWTNIESVIKYYSTKNGSYVEDNKTVLAECFQDKLIDIFY